MKGTILEGLKPSADAGIGIEVGSLMSFLSAIEDPRAARGKRYELVHLLTLLILAKLGGQDTMRGMAEWVQLRGEALIEMLQLPRTSLPHQTTYERVLAKLDVAVFEQQVNAFFAMQSRGEETISVDGKTLRGTIPAGSSQGVHVLTAYDVEQSVPLLQVPVETKANEITVAPDLLAAVPLADKIVTADAMLTQTTLCDQIVQAGGHYVLPIKANHPHLLHAIAESFVPPPPSHGYPQQPLPTRHAKTVNKGHGRIEWRWVDAHSHLNDFLDWPHLAQVFRLQRVVHYQNSQRLTYQVVFGITSLAAPQASPDRLLALVRAHWHIENRLHYVRDVTFHEDACTIRHPLRQRFLAALNNLAIGLIRQCDFDFVPQARRFFAVNFHQAFHLLC